MSSGKCLQVNVTSIRVSDTNKRFRTTSRLSKINCEIITTTANYVLLFRSTDMTTSPLPQSQSGRSYALAGTVLHAALLAFIAFMFWRAPSVKQKMDDFGVTLPWITVKIYQLSDWFNENKVLASLALSLFITLDLTLLQSLGRNKRSHQLICILVVGLVLLFIGICLTVGIELPRIKLGEALAH
jgi:hypothetical protein